MSKPSRHRILVTQEQYDWIAKSVLRKNDQARSMDSLNKRLLEELAIFADRFVNPPEIEGDKLILPSTRNELRILEQIAENERAALVDQVVPNYEQRNDLVYAAAASKRADQLSSLLLIIRKAMS